MSVLDALLDENVDEVVKFMNKRGKDCFDSKSQYSSTERKIPRIEELVKDYAIMNNLQEPKEISKILKKLVEQSFWNGYHLAEISYSFLPG